LKNDSPLKSCGGRSGVHVHPPKADMHMYGTAKETEQMLKNGFQLTAQINFFFFCREVGKAFYKKQGSKLFCFAK
jgi:hypothetical protein